ncbi:MAG: TlpA disulfide reductase family protein [Phycisphaeraceae bacterium]
MRIMPTVTFVCLTVLLAGASIAASPPGDRLIDQVQEAYDQTNQYHATQRLEIREVSGRWTTVRSTDLTLAFDRENERLLLVRPDVTLVVNDGRLYLKSDDLAGRHLDTEAPSPLSYEALSQLVPVLGNPPPIELAFLLADDPVAAMANGQQAHMETQAPAEGDDEQRQRLQMIAPPVSLTMSVDNDARLIESAVFDVDAAATGMAADDSFAMHLDFTLETHNEPIDASVFDFDPPANSTAAASWQELVQAAGGGGGGNRGGAHALEGNDAPAVELPTMAGEAFKLDEVEADVVVLDFWATWCPPCWEGLRKLQAVHEWAAEGDRSVAIYAVNLQETVEEAREYWEREGLTMPVVMDEQGTAAQAYGVQAIPQTVVIHDGKVQHIHVGAGPDLDEQLKAEITALLEEE